MDQRKILEKYLVEAAVLFDRVVTKDLVAVWMDRTKDLPPEKLALALNAHLNEGNRFPVPADIISRVKGTTEEKAILAWEGMLRGDVFGPSTKAARALACSGYSNRTETKELNVCRRAFIDAFVALEKGEQPSRAIPYDQEHAAALPVGTKIETTDGRKGTVTAPPYQGALRVRLDGDGWASHVPPERIANVLSVVKS